MKAIAPVLNSLERTALRNAQKVIEKGQRTFLEVGNALMEIRDANLFRETHETFKTYCRDKWGFEDSRARQLIGGAETAKRIESVTTVTLLPPSGERQVRPLAKLPEDQQAAAWADAVDEADGEQPTAAQVQGVVDLYLADNEPPDSPESPPDAREHGTTSGSAKPPKGRQQATGQPDRGKCPVCAGTKWKEDDDGVSCSKCHHPWGEPAGDPDEDRIKTQRQKTVKTVEALMRAFDDLQAMKARQEHTGPTKWIADEVDATLRDMGVIAACKGLLKLAKGWK